MTAVTPKRSSFGWSHEGRNHRTQKRSRFMKKTQLLVNTTVIRITDETKRRREEHKNMQYALQLNVLQICAGNIKINRVNATADHKARHKVRFTQSN
jgi:hypothetical protein